MNNSPFGTPNNQQTAAADKTLVIITLGFVASCAALVLTSFLIAGNIQRRSVPLAPPSGTVEALCCGAALLCLLGSVYWVRSRVIPRASSPGREFASQVIISIALANLAQYLGVVWVILGGSFASAIPFFAGTALVILLFVLPAVLARSRRTR